jgi:acetaldehyde dehydrogenase
MRDTIFCNLPRGTDTAEVERSIVAMVADVQQYVPGYRLTAEPQFDEGRVAIFIEVEGAGDYLPAYSGNLDIMTAAATRVGEQIAARVAQPAAVWARAAPGRAGQKETR